MSNTLKSVILIVWTITLLVFALKIITTFQNIIEIGVK